VCDIIVQKLLGKVDGVIKAEASSYTRTAVVTFDDEKTDLQALTQATTQAVLMAN